VKTFEYNVVESPTPLGLQDLEYHQSERWELVSTMPFEKREKVQYIYYFKREVVAEEAPPKKAALLG